MENSRDKLWNQCKNTSHMSDALGSFPDEPLLAVVDRALSYLRDFYRAYFGPKENAGQLKNSGLTSDVQECSNDSELLVMNPTSSTTCIDKSSQDHLRSCATNFRSQCKNTSLMSDALGSFPDEPLLTEVDKELYYLCDLYHACFGPKGYGGQFKNSELTSGISFFIQDHPESAIHSFHSNVQECSDVPEPLFMNPISSTAYIDSSSQDKPRCRTSSIWSSCPNLDTQLSKEYLMPQKKKRDVIPSRINAKSENHSWVNAKVMRNGVKCFEIVTSAQEQNPSFTLIVPPSGHVVPFESVPNDI